MKASKGFTLVELVVVIVILGILAAVAIPRFVDLSPQAHNAAAQGVAAAIASGTATNYAARKAGAAGTQAINSATACAGTEVTTKMQALVSGVTLTTAAPLTNNEFQVSGAADCSASDGQAKTTCTVTPFGGAAQALTFICAL